MNDLLTNLVELVKMIFACIIKPNYGGTTNNTLLNVLFNAEYANRSQLLICILLIPFGLLCIGVCLGFIRRLLCRN